MNISTKISNTGVITMKKINFFETFSFSKKIIINQLEPNKKLKITNEYIEKRSKIKKFL